jgi:WD40 repeat protein
MAGYSARVSAGTLLLLLALALPCAGQETARVPVPDKAALEKAAEQLRARHKADYEKVQKSPAAGTDLAQALLQEAHTLKKEDPGRYVRLREARDLAARAGEMGGMLQAVAEMTRDYAVSGEALQAEALETAVASLTDPEPARALVEVGLGLAAAALEKDLFEPAGRLAHLAEQAARKSRDLPLVLSVQHYEHGVAAARAQFARLKPFRDRLRQDPEDPEANREVGRYLTLFKGDFSGPGLFLLAQGKDPDLRLLAQRDLARPEGGAAEVALGDAWWQQSEKAPEPAKVHLRQRAVYWYEQALQGLEGSARGRLEERIALVPRLPLRVLGLDYVGPARELRVLRGHANAVLTVAFAPDGQKVLSGDQGGQAILWETGTGRQVHVLAGHGNRVPSVACDPQGRSLFTASWDGTVKMWDARTGRELRRFPAKGRVADLNGLAVSPDGKRLLTGGADMIVRLWDVESGRELRQLRGHGAAVQSLAVSPDGKQALSGGNGDGTMILWDLPSGTLLRQFQGLRGAVQSVAFSPDGRQALSAGDSEVQLWDLRTGQVVRHFRGHSLAVNAVAFAPDGKRILSGSSDGTVRLWDVATGRELHRFTGHHAVVYSVAFSPGGGRAASGGQDGTVRIWGLPR